MKCRACGNEIADDSLFCTFCGAKVEEMQNAPNEQQNVTDNTDEVNLEEGIVKNMMEQEAAEASAEAEQPVQQEAPAEAEQPVQQEAPAEAEQPAKPETPAQPVQSETPVQPVQPTQQYEAPQQGAQPNTAATAKSKTNFLTIGIIVVLIIVVIAAIIFLVSKVFGNLGGSKNDKAIAYVSDGEVFYTANMDKDKDPISVSKVRGSEADYDNDLKLTSDGKYLYFASKVEDDGNTICRAEVGKLKADSKKNDKYIVEIDKGITSYRLLSDEKQMLYTKYDGSLNYYDGDSEDCIEKDVNDYYLVDEHTVVYLTDDGDLCYYDLKSKKDDTIDDDVSGIDKCDSKDFIVYEKDYEDLYCGSIDGDSEKIETGIDSYIGCDEDKKTVYYTVSDSDEQGLYAYIDDKYADDDAKVEEPDVKTCLTAVTEEEALPEYEKEYLAEYPDEKDDFYRDLYYQSDLNMYYMYNIDNDKEYLYDDLAKQWYVFDEDKYDELDEAYSEVADRIELREELKDASVDTTVSELYSCVVGKDPECINENVSSYAYCSYDGSILYYSAAGDTTEKISIDDVTSVYDAQYQVEDMLSDAGSESFCYVDGNEQSMDVDGDICSADVSAYGNEVIFGIRDDGVTSLVAYSLKKGTLTEGDELTDDGSYGTWIDKGYYFFSDVSDDEGDLNVYKNGKTECILEGVSSEYLERYDDGTFTALDNYDGDGTLVTFTASGDETKISKNVSTYSRVNAKRIVYMKNDNLYVHTGKKDDRKIAKDVVTYDCVEAPYDVIY